MKKKESKVESQKSKLKTDHFCFHFQLSTVNPLLFLLSSDSYSVRTLTPATSSKKVMTAA